MAEKAESPTRNRFSLRDVPGTTIAVAALAVLGAAAIVSAPFSVWYWRKRKRAEALASHPAAPDATPGADSTSQESAEPRGPLSAD